jgi:hypothetical protein
MAAFLVKDLDRGYLIQGTQDIARARRILTAARPDQSFEIVKAYSGYFRSADHDHSIFGVYRVSSKARGAVSSVLFHTIPKESS